MSTEPSDTTAASPRPTDPLKVPRKDFLEMFEQHCRYPLLPDAERKLAEIFEQTIAYAVYVRHVDWPNDPVRRAVAMKGTRDIAILCRQRSPLVVTEPILTAAADEVICAARADCMAQLKKKGRAVIDYVFCEAYEGNCAAIAAAGGSQGGGGGPSAAAAPDDMVARAHGDFMKRVKKRIKKKPLGPGCETFLECLFERTVKNAIVKKKCDWDKDRKRRKFALRRLAEIAELAAVCSPDEAVDCKILAQVADRVITTWSHCCKARVRYVFCEEWIGLREEDPCACREDGRAAPPGPAGETGA